MDPFAEVDVDVRLTLHDLQEPDVGHVLPGTEGVPQGSPYIGYGQSIHVGADAVGVVRGGSGGAVSV